MKLAHLERGSPEWERAWSEIEAAYGDRACRCPDTGEAWQYMGTVRADNPGERRWAHQFRHRHLPATGDREYVNVAAPPGWEPEDVQRPLGIN